MSQLLQDLKTSTRPQHDQIEKTIDFLREDMTLEDYKYLLKKFYGFYYTFEKFLKETNLPLDYSQRYKLPRLKNDLENLGMSSQEIEKLPVLKMKFPSSLEVVLGQLYVIEGSTLGGMVLKKHFEKKFSLTPDTGLSFFTGYGAETMSFWKEFQEILIESSSEKANPLIIDSAQITFLTLETWMK